MPTLNTFAERLSYALMVKGHSQRSLARYIGSADTIVSGYCLGKREPSPKKLVNIAIFLDVSLDWLMSGKGSIKEQFDYKTVPAHQPYTVQIDKSENGIINLIIRLSDAEAKNIFHFLAKNA